MAGARISGGKGGRRGGPPGGINYQGKRWFENKPTSGGKVSGINWELHGKASGFYQCLAIAQKHMPPAVARGFCSNRGLAATGRRPGSGNRGGGKGGRIGK